MLLYVGYAPKQLLLPTLTLRVCGGGGGGGGLFIMAKQGLSLLLLHYYIIWIIARHT